MEKKSVHLVEADLEAEQWIERYAEIKNLSIQETLVRMLRAGRCTLENQELEGRQLKKETSELPIRVNIGLQAVVECLAILRKAHLPDLDSQKRLALEVKQLIEKTVRQRMEEKAP